MNQPLLIGVIIVCFVAVLAWQQNKIKQIEPNSAFLQNKNESIVIILNGPSASGKSSIQKEFQKMMMPNLWIKHGIDSLFDGPMPDITPENMAFWQTPNPIRWIETTKDDTDNPIITLLVGDQGERVALGMNSAIVAYAQNGNNLIIDYIAYKKSWIDDLQSKLKHAKIKTYWVKVTLPLEILEQRETARATSPKGHGRSHYNTVHHDISYDLELDTSKLTSKDCAQKIYDLINKKSSE